MRAQQVVGLQATDVVESGQQHARVAVLFTADREHVEQGRPHHVVDAQAEFREPDRDRVVAVGRRWRHHDAQTGDRRLGRGLEAVRRWQEPLRVGRMVRPTVGLAQSGADQSIGALRGQEDAELVRHAARCCATDLGADAQAVGDDALVAPDRQLAAVSCLHKGQHGLGAADVVEMGVDHRSNRAGAVLPDSGQRVRHLLDALAGVDRDQALRAFDKSLVRQAVADHAPDARSRRPELALEPVVVGDGIAVGALALPVCGDD